MSDDRGLSESPQETQALMDNLAFEPPTDREHEAALLVPRAVR